jgi:hypothetical protein
MSQSHRDKSLFSNHDQNYHSVPTYETDGQEQAFVNAYGTSEPYQYWDPSMEQPSYVPFAPTGLYQPFEYQIAQPIYPQEPSLVPASVSNISNEKTSARLPPAPLGRTPLASSAVLTSATPDHHTPVDATTVPPLHYSHLPLPYAYAHPPPPPYYYPQPPPAPYYYPQPPSAPYYYPQPPSAPYYHSRRPPPSYDYYDRSNLPQ